MEKSNPPEGQRNSCNFPINSFMVLFFSGKNKNIEKKNKNHRPHPVRICFFREKIHTIKKRSITIVDTDCDKSLPLKNMSFIAVGSRNKALHDNIFTLNSRLGFVRSLDSEPVSLDSPLCPILWFVWLLQF